MIQEAAAFGLLVDDRRAATVLGRAGGGYVQASPEARLHDSMRGFWPLAEFAPKKHWNAQEQRDEIRFNLFRRRATGPAPIVHDVAWMIPGYASRVPRDAVRLGAKT